MVLPVIDHAAQQVGAAKKGAVVGRGAADHQVVSAAGPGVLPVEHELLGSQSGLARQLIHRRDVLDQCVPARGRLDVDLDHAGIGSDLEDRDTGVIGRGVAFEDDRHGEMRSRVFDSGDQVKIVREVIDRRHEDEELALARLHAERRAGERDRLLIILFGLGLIGGGLRFVRERRIEEPAHLTIGAWVQLVPPLERVGIEGVGHVFRLGPGQRFKRQTIPHGRIAGSQKHAF